MFEKNEFAEKHVKVCEHVRKKACVSMCRYVWVCIGIQRYV